MSEQTAEIAKIKRRQRRQKLLVPTSNLTIISKVQPILDRLIYL